MLNTLNACVAVVVVATGCGTKYIPSHEAIAGDGMNIRIWVFLYLFGCMRLGAFAPRKINIYVQIIVKPCIQSRDNGAKYKKSIDCRAPRGFSQRQYCKYGRNNNKTMRR
jgi:hypothetical protein